MPIRIHVQQRTAGLKRLVIDVPGQVLTIRTDRGPNSFQVCGASKITAKIPIGAVVEITQWEGA